MIKLGGIVYVDAEDETHLISEIAKQGAMEKLFTEIFDSKSEGST